MAISKMTKRFATDENAEEDGRWVDFGDGIRVKVRRLRSKKSRDVRASLEKPYADKIRRGPLPEEEAEALLIKQIALGVIADWENVDRGDGHTIPYTGSNAIEVCTKFPEFRESVLQIAIDADNFRQSLDEEGLENLADTSRGA